MIYDGMPRLYFQHRTGAVTYKGMCPQSLCTCKCAGLARMRTNRILFIPVCALGAIASYSC